MKQLNQKIVVITGAASGMGRAYADAFAKEGCQLALCDLDQAGLLETAELITKQTGKAPLTTAFDIADRDATFEFAQEVSSKLGETDILINNAGIEGSAKPVWATDEVYFQRVMNVNYFGVVNGTLAFLPKMRERDEGVIVNVSSIFGLIGAPNHADYCGSKFAVRGFTEALMSELCESRIQVHLLHPGGIATNIARQKHSQNFAGHFFKTSAEAVAEQVIQSIRTNTPRIVFGHGAKKAFLGSRVLPLGLLKKLTWHELKKVIDVRDYPSFSKKISGE